MQMTKAQAIAELEHIYEILPLIAEAVEEERKPINQYGKQNLQELCGNVCQQHERFKKELIRAIDAGIRLVILVEHGSDIQSLEDVWFWKNPRKHEVRWRMVNGKKERYVVSAKAVDGEQLYKSLCTIRDRYNVRFEFCNKKDTGKRIIEILSDDL